MRPVLFSWRGIEVPSYPACLYVGLISALAAQNWVANRIGEPSDRVFIATIALLIPALVGARLLFIATHWPQFRRNLSRVWRIADGGATFYGGIPLALLTSFPVLRALEIPFLGFWDLATVAFVVAGTFGKLGCFLHGCCVGRPATGWVSFRIRDYRG